MDTKNLILTIIFTFSLLLLWESWNRYNNPIIENKDKEDLPVTSSNKIDSIKNQEANTKKPEEVPSSTLLKDSIVDSTNLENLNNEKTTKNNFVTLENEDLKIFVNLRGAKIEYAELINEQSDLDPSGHVVLFNNNFDERYEAQSGIFAFPGGGDVFPNHTNDFQIVSSGSKNLILRSAINKVVLRKTISLDSRGYLITINNEVFNERPDSIDVGIYYQLLRNGNPPKGGSSFYQTFTGPAFYTEKDKFQKVDFEDIADNKAEHVKKSQDGWLGIVQHHYVSALLLPNSQPREFYTKKVADNLYSVGAVQYLGQIKPNSNLEHQAQIFVGPQLQSVLKELSPGLDLVVDYGILTVIAKPIFWLLEKIFSFVGNWGWAIVVLTIIIKLIFYPLTAASYRSMAKMKAVTPRMVKIREQFKDDKMQMNKALMDLYTKEKINPLGGCLPILVQIPVFIALYWVLLGSVEIRNAPWIFWIDDLSVPDPYYILPLIMALTMFIQMKLNPTPPDPLQAKIMMLMPVIFSIFFFFFPSGLVLYWLVNNVVSIAQQWSIMRKLNVKV